MAIILCAQICSWFHFAEQLCCRGVGFVKNQTLNFHYGCNPCIKSLQHKAGKPAFQSPPAAILYNMVHLGLLPLPFPLPANKSLSHLPLIFIKPN